MPMPLHTGRLVLTPVDAQAAPDPKTLRQAIADGALAGEPLRNGTDGFSVGDRFLQLVAFTGCAVQLAPEPERGAAHGFCHIRVDGPFPRPQLRAGRNSRPPRCAVCGKPLQEWREQASTWLPSVSPALGCRSCKHTSPAWDWDWRQQAGLGRIFLCIEEVFPGEAAPLPGLLELLAQTAVGPWGFFYVQD